MNEEVVVRFGGDLTPLGNSLRGMNQAIKNAGAEAKKSFQEGFGNIGQIISGGAIIAGIKGLLDKFDELQDRAENLSISTDFLQGMQHIASKDAVGGVETFNKAIGELSVVLGQAKDGGDEALKKFEKWGFTLKDISELDTEGMFYKIADRIKSIPDPAQRSAAAFELMGKAGKNLVGVMQDGAAAVKGMVDQVDKLDAEKIKQLAEAKDTIENTKNTTTIWAGKALGAVGKFGHFLGNLSVGDPGGLNDIIAANNAPKKSNQAGAGDQTLLAKQAADLLEARNKYLDAVSAGYKDEDKLSNLVRHRHDLMAKINALQGESVEKYGLMTQLATAEKDINELNAKITKDKVDKQKEAAEAKKKHLEEEKKLNEEIAKTRREISDTSSSIANRGAQYATLQEVAQSGYYGVSGSATLFMRGPNAQEAQNVLDLQAQAKSARMFGNADYARQLESRAQQLQSDLQDRGVIAPDEGLKGANEKLADLGQKMGDLLSQAKTDGIKVKGPED